MAPDLEKRRQELRRGSSGTLDHVSDHLGMLLRCAGGTADLHRHGSNAGGTSSTVTASSVSRSTAGNRAHSATRRTITDQQQQQQQTSQQQQPKQSRFPLSSFGGVTARSSDEHGPRTGTTPDDNSNDSGLGSEERQQHFNNISLWNNVGEEDSKRRKMDIKLESEDANFAFPEVAPGTSPDNKSSTVRTTVNGIGLGGISGNRSGNANSIGRVVGVTRPRPAMGVLTKRTPITHQGPVTLISQLSNVSADGKTQLQIICQPEQQHRARYQTEGSRGAVKDRSGNGFPIVRLIGYDKPTTLQVFIGTDLGRVAPHMFYQACRVSGKNSTPCIERKIDGTIVIEIDMDPAKDVTCDCVGILKERNVDVEHRFPQEAGLLQGRSKKKSTRCRMIFRTTITHADGTTETLQICSQPIVCTQPPGIPEICKKSLTSCPCTGGLELIILGKNFLKDTRVVFQLDSDDLSSSLEPHWECTVLPDKEHLHPVHLVCVIPPYCRQDLAPTETVSVRLFAVSSGKTSEPHTFLYTAASTPPQPSIGKVESISPPLTNGDASLVTSSTALPLATNVVSSSLLTQTAAGAASFLSNASTQSQQSTSSETLKNDPSPPPAGTSQVTPVMLWASQSSNSPSDVMMPPPVLVANPLMNRRSSSNLQLILPDNLKTEVLDENSQNSMLSENSMQSIPTPTTATNGPTSVTSPLQQLVNENSREAATSQADIIRNVAVATANNSPVQETVSGLLGVVDLIRTHPLSIVNTHHPTSFGGMHESNQVQVLSPHRLKDTNGVLSTDNSSNGAALQGAGVVDLRMKHHHHHHHPDFGTLSSFTGATGTQSLSASNSHVVEKYLNHMESSVGTTEESDNPENEFAMQQQRASIISGSSQQSAAPPGILTNTGQTSVKLDALVNSAAEQMVSPLHSENPNPTAMLSHVTAEHEPMSSGQQTRTSPPIPVKTMLLEALSQTVQPLAEIAGTTPISPATTVEQTGDNLLTTINAALLPQLPETQVSAATSNSTVAGNAIPAVAEHMQQQIQALTQQEVAVMQQQVQQVEQVVAQAQQQVEQVVAQAHQQAAHVKQQAEQQVVQQVFQHAKVVQHAVQQVQAVQQVHPAHVVHQALQQATEEVVQQAVQQATQEVVQQVQAVQQAVQQAQAAQAMQQAVQQDIGSMLNQPAGFVAEASSALASGAAQELSQQRLTNAAEQAINNVITNATKDIINNRPISTTTAHAIMATKNILNSVATQSAQLMNNAMEVILPKSPSAQNNIIEQVASKSPPVALSVSPNRQAVNAPISNSASNTASNRKTEDGMLPQELTSMSEHDLLSYINPNCFEQLPQSGFLL